MGIGRKRWWQANRWSLATPVPRALDHSYREFLSAAAAAAQQPKEQIVMRKREEEQWPTCSERIAQ
jgi:hypothetical protein